VTTTERVLSVEGWFTTSEPYTLIGAKCPECGTFVFPPRLAPPRPSPKCANSSGSCRVGSRAIRSEGATTGLASNQGLFGHGSCTILST